jgi:hypothetical protein
MDERPRAYLGPLLYRYLDENWLIERERFRYPSFQFLRARHLECSNAKTVAKGDEVWISEV